MSRELSRKQYRIYAIEKEINTNSRHIMYHESELRSINSDMIILVNTKGSDEDKALTLKKKERTKEKIESYKLEIINLKKEIEKINISIIESDFYTRLNEGEYDDKLNDNEKNMIKDIYKKWEHIRDTNGLGHIIDTVCRTKNKIKDSELIEIRTGRVDECDPPRPGFNYFFIENNKKFTLDFYHRDIVYINEKQSKYRTEKSCDDEIRNNILDIVDKYDLKKKLNDKEKTIINNMLRKWKYFRDLTKIDRIIHVISCAKNKNKNSVLYQLNVSHNNVMFDPGMDFIFMDEKGVIFTHRSLNLEGV
jgi:hypothetical protein